MEPLHLFVHSATPETATRIERALRAGEPDCTVEFVTDSATLAAQVQRNPEAAAVAAAPETSVAGDAKTISSALRHDLNNHLGLIRMLADLLADNRTYPAAVTARAREIGVAADAAAQAIRQTKNDAK